MQKISALTILQVFCPTTIYSLRNNTAHESHYLILILYTVLVGGHAKKF